MSGLGRVIAAEHPELGCTRIDLDPKHHGDEADQLAEELWSGQSEDQVAFREGERLVARLRRLDHVEPGSLQVPRDRPYRLEITGAPGTLGRGQLDNVALQSAQRQRQGQVRSRSGSAPRGSISATC